MLSKVNKKKDILGATTVVMHMQDDEKCPARNKECLKCHKVGHFA